MKPHGACRITVVIKALDEEARIARAVQSALAAVAAIGGGEVVLADCGSADRTIEIAAAFPIRIVQLADPRERGCGIGAQLGWQHSRGEYLYLMDGDMELQPGFLEQGLAFLAQHPEMAGVGGRVLERNLESMEYRERQARAQAHLQPGLVDRLDAGGLYRRFAIQEAGYLADRNLHSYEEFDLGARLRTLGWKLWRLPVDAVSHQGHATPALRLLARRWATGYAFGSGEVLRAALGESWLPLVLRDLRELRLYAGMWLWWAGLLGLALAPGPALLRGSLLALLALALPLAMVLRKRSLQRGGYALVSWSVQAAGLARGLLHARRPPRARIASRVLREPQDPLRPQPGPGVGAPTPGRPARNP